MVKIKIMKPGSAVAVDYEEAEAEEMFKKVATVLLNIKGTEPEKKLPEEKRRKVEIAPVQMEGSEMAAEDKSAPAPAEETGQRSTHLYGGFLYIKCGHCGNERAYCQKQSSGYSICTKCGSRTYFGETLRQLYLTCECGQKYRYRTNMTDEMFDINCINCQAPMAVKYNQKQNCYETIG